jgi:hypothetical protein
MLHFTSRVYELHLGSFRASGAAQLGFVPKAKTVVFS